MDTQRDSGLFRVFPGRRRMDVSVSGGREGSQLGGGEGENGKQKTQGGHGGTGSQTRPRRRPVDVCDMTGNVCDMYYGFTWM